MAIGATTSGTANTTQTALEISAAQITSTWAYLPTGQPYVPYKVGGGTYASAPIPGTFANGTYYPNCNNQNNAPGPFTGVAEEFWPDYATLNQYNVIWNMTNSLYRI